MSGRLEIITGCMFSGKSEELIRRLRRAAIANQRVLCIKPAIDDRYSATDVVSHSGDRMTSHVVHSSMGILDLVSAHDPEVVGIEEVQFLGLALPEVCRQLVSSGIRVICAGLDLDCFERPFEPMPQLLCEADQVDKLSAVCMVCHGDAVRSQLLIDGQPAPYTDQPVINIGAQESYQARCRSCHQVPGR